MSDEMKEAHGKVVGLWGTATAEQKEAVATAFPDLAEALTAQQAVVEKEAEQA